MKKLFLICCIAFIMTGCATPEKPNTPVSEISNVTVSSSEIINGIPEITDFMEVAKNLYGDCSYVRSEGDSLANLKVWVKDKKYGFEYEITTIGAETYDAYGNLMSSNAEITPLYEAGYIGYVNQCCIDAYKTIEDNYGDFTIEISNDSMPVIYYDDEKGIIADKVKDIALEVAEVFKATDKELNNDNVIEYEYYTIRVISLTDNYSIGYVNMDDLSWVQR